MSQKISPFNSGTSRWVTLNLPSSLKDAMIGLTVSHFHPMESTSSLACVVIFNFGMLRLAKRHTKGTVTQSPLSHFHPTEST